jgi:radical SAM protein with 4Fe4S-binding SPASM domain
MIRQLADIASVNLFKHFGAPKITPQALYLITTYLCNSKCRTCNIWKIYKEDSQKLTKELEIEEIRRLIIEAINLGVRYIWITGGEPFLRPSSVEISSMIGKTFKSSGLVTNGLASSIIYEKTKTIMDNIPKSHFFTVAVSIDGLEQKHDFQRGVNGAFQKSIKTIKLLKQLQNKYPNLNIDISFTLTNENYEDLEPTFSYLLDEKLISHPSHFSFRYAQENKIVISPGDAKNKNEVITAIRDFQKSYPYFKNKFINGIIEYIKFPSKLISPCYTLFSSVWIDPYGDVFPCAGMMENGIIGNVRQTEFDLKNIWFSEQADKQRIKIKKGQCPNCWVECHSIDNIKYSIYRPSNFWYMLSRNFQHKRFF